MAGSSGFSLRPKWQEPASACGPMFSPVIPRFDKSCLTLFVNRCSNAISSCSYSPRSSANRRSRAVKNPIRFPNNQTMLRSVVWSTFVLLSLLVVPAKPLAPIQTGPGQPVRVEGEVEVVYEDSHGHGRLFYFLHTGSKKLELRFTHNAPP